MTNIKIIIKKIESSPQWELEKIMGKKQYMDTPGFCHQRGEVKNYNGILDCMKQNMGEKDFNKLIIWIKKNPAKVKKIMDL